MKIKVEVAKGGSGIEAWMKKISNFNPEASLSSLGQNGVKNLISATPKRTGATSLGWYYTVKKTKSGYDLIFKNRAHNGKNVSVAMLLQYGHGNGRGGYTPPRDYINPALSNVFGAGIDKIVKEVLR